MFGENKIYINFRSSDLLKLEQFFFFLKKEITQYVILKDKTKYFFLPYLGIDFVNFSKPRGDKVFSLLRSPHLNKKSQEQFAIGKYVMRLCLKFKSMSFFCSQFNYFLFHFYKKSFICGFSRESHTNFYCKSKFFFYKAGEFLY